MGRRVRFYTLPNDEELFWDFFRLDQEIYSLFDKSTISSVTSFILPWSREPSKPVFRKLYIGRCDHNSLNSFIRKGSRKIYSEETMDYVDTGEQFFLSTWMHLSLNIPHHSYVMMEGWLKDGY